MAAYEKYLPGFESLSEAYYRNLIVFSALVRRLQGDHHTGWSKYESDRAEAGVVCAA
jgi:hypothetical protein